MTPISRSLCWAGALIALAFANRFGLITDHDASTLFVIIPALFAATGGLNRAPGARRRHDCAAA